MLQRAHLAGSVLRVKLGAVTGRDPLGAGSLIGVAAGLVIGREMAFGDILARLNGLVPRTA